TGSAKLLPSYDAVVLDEAHRLEEVASDHLGGRLSMGQVEYLLNSLYSQRAGRGLLTSLEDAGESARQAVLSAARANEKFFADIGQWQRNYGRSNGRLTEPDVVDNPLSPALQDLAGRLRELSLKLQENQLELAAYASQAEELASQLRVLLDQTIDSAVYWLEPELGHHGRSGRIRWRIICAPVHVGPDLQRMLWSKADSVVLTGATLAGRPLRVSGNSGPARDSQGDFEFLRSRLGLQQTKRSRLGSPFDFARQVKVYIEAGLPNPNNQQEFLPGACQAIKKYIRMSGGRAFILFTSWQLLDKTADELAQFFDEEGVTLLIQKQGASRTRLLNTFRKDTQSVLFGTASFWQGVDVKGPALSNVIITKLPFAVPDEPLIQARLEQIRSEGGNPFVDYQLPEAVLRFKQGFGRLIRSSRDRGIVVILDGRVLSRWYGKRFLQALP
ncbi:MAG: helicase, partial [Phycisphaerae bacterium]|nr:helicase [Phycisphaerae bacterium]